MYGQQRWAEAAEALTWIVDEGSEDVATRRDDLVRLAELLSDRLGRPDEGLTRFEEASRLAPEDPELLRRLLEGYRRAGDEARAADAAGSLARLAADPDEAVEAHITHGEAALAAERPGEAVAAFARALDLEPARTNGALGLAQARERLDDLSGAAAVLARHAAAARAAARKRTASRPWSSSGATGARLASILPCPGRSKFPRSSART